MYYYTTTLHLTSSSVQLTVTCSVTRSISGYRYKVGAVATHLNQEYRHRSWLRNWIKGTEFSRHKCSIISSLTVYQFLIGVLVLEVLLSLQNDTFAVREVLVWMVSGTPQQSFEKISWYLDSKLLVNIFLSSVNFCWTLDIVFER